MMHGLGSRARGAALFALVVAACADHDDAPSTLDAAAARVDVPAVPAPPLAQAALERQLVPLALDDAGHPRLVRAAAPLLPRPGATRDVAAIEFVDAATPIWGVRTPADLGVDGVHRLRGGATLVALRQEVGGVPVWGGRISVLTRADGALLAIGGTRVARGDGVKGAYRLDARAATAIAVADRFPADAALGPSQAKRALLPEADRLRSTWMVEAYGAPAGSTDAHLWRVFVDAGTGDVVRRDDLTVDVAFTYRVFADADAAGRPFDGPQQSFMPHPSGTPDGSQPGFVAPNLVTMDGFNTNPMGAVDPWLAAAATTTNGNNVDAYADRAAPDGLSGTDFRASTTSTRTFDRTYDPAQGPLVSQAQGMAAVTTSST